jgi:predicted methyltransferase
MAKKVVLTKDQAKEIIVKVLNDNFKVTDDNYLQITDDWNPIYYSVDTNLENDEFADELVNLLCIIPGLEHISINDCDLLSDVLNNNFKD